MPKKYAPKSKTTDTYAQTRYNSVQHGTLSRLSVLPWENAQDLEEIRTSFLEEYQAKGATETYLVLELATIVFRKQRLYQAENALVYKRLDGLDGYSLSGIAKEAGLLTKEACKRGDYKNQDKLKDVFYYDLAIDQEEIDYFVRKINHAQNLIDSNVPYEKMLEKLDPDLLENWKTYEDEYELNRDGLVVYLEEKIIKFSKEKISSIKARPHVQQQAIGSAYIPNDKTETLQRYETGLDRKFERTLSMVLKLQDIRKAQSTIISANTG